MKLKAYKPLQVKERHFERHAQSKSSIVKKKMTHDTSFIRQSKCIQNAITPDPPALREQNLSEPTTLNLIELTTCVKKKNGREKKNDSIVSQLLVGHGGMLNCHRRHGQWLVVNE